MSKSRYFMSKDLTKLEDAYVCFRYWSGKVDSQYNLPCAKVSVIKNKLTKDSFAKVQASDYTQIFDSKTGKTINKGTIGFKEAALNTSAEVLSANWLQQKLGNGGINKIILFITRFARVHGILAQNTEKPLITMALSKEDWTKVRDNIIQTKISGLCNKYGVTTEGGGRKLVCCGGELSEGDNSIEDANKSASCIDLVEVDKNGKPLEKPPAKSSAK